MNLRQMEVFLTVTETKSMSKAAKELYISQPAISKTIAELEESLETKLFERINRQLILTNEGEILYTYAKRIIGLIDEVKHHIKDLNHMKSGHLSVGASTTIGIYLLPYIIGQFNQLYPEVKLNFIIDNTSVIEALLLEAQIDIGIVEGPILSPDLDLIHFAKDSLQLICSNKHKWALENRKIITIDEFEKETLILREAGSGTREIIENVLQSKKVNYKSSHILNNTEAIKKAVMANIGIAIVSEFAVRDEVANNQLLIMDLQGIKFSRDLDLVFHKNKYKSPLFNEFINFVKNYGYSLSI